MLTGTNWQIDLHIKQSPSLSVMAVTNQRSCAVQSELFYFIFTKCFCLPPQSPLWGMDVLRPPTASTPSCTSTRDPSRSRRCGGLRASSVEASALWWSCLATGVGSVRLTQADIMLLSDFGLTFRIFFFFYTLEESGNINISMYLTQVSRKYRLGKKYMAIFSRLRQ